MEKERLITLLKKPELFSMEDTKNLEELLKESPYFQTAHQLLLLQLYKSSPDRFDQELLSSALQVADRTILFNRLHGVESPDLFNFAKIDTKEVGSSEKIISEKKVFPEVKGQGNDFILEENKPVELLTDFPVSEEQTSGALKGELLDLEQENVVIKPESTDEFTEKSEIISDAPLEKEKLIDQFLENIPVFKPARIIEEDPIKDIASDSVKKDEEVVTETLAAIYMNQELFESAISVYEKLICKYPEKSTYFASRIDDIKKLIK